MSPLVSIIIPVYNVEKYVEGCLESVRNQTYENWEAIIVNDGSPDASAEICKKYIESHKDERFRLYTKPNGGLSDARNYGLDKTSQDSEYVVFLDSDDELTPDALEKLMKYATHNSLVIGSFVRCYKNSKPKLQDQSHTNTYSNFWGDTDFLNKINKGIINSCWGKCYSLQQIRKNSLKFQKELPEDTTFNIDYLSVVDTVSLLTCVIYYYYIWSGSMSTKPQEEIYKNYLKIQQRLYEKTETRNHIFIDRFVYPQYRVNTIKYLRKGEYAIPKRYLKIDLVKKSIASYNPVSIADYIVHACLRFNILTPLRFL
ncbi:MAG: glycosyltransferase [Muribaculaceae bacterium]|nr:glycosyltransferase [Muribaculaceae bacterium]